MSKSSGSTTVGTIIILIGALFLGSTLAGAPSSGGISSSALLPGIIMVWFGLTVRARAKKQSSRPQVPDGFAPAHPDQVQEQQAPEPAGVGSVDMPRGVEPPAVQPPAVQPPAVPLPAVEAYGGQHGEVQKDDVLPVRTEVEAQVVALAAAGRTVEAIEVLREATGMELYEASQYVRNARRSAG